MGKKILLVNTGSKRKEFIFRKLKESGVFLVVLNNEVNWADRYVDEWIIADTSDRLKVKIAVEKYLTKNGRVDGVSTYWESDVELAAFIREEFGYLGNSAQAASLARNKARFRNFCYANNLPAPKSMVVSSLSELETVKKNFEFPLVIKPKYGAGSSSVRKVETIKELMIFFKGIKEKLRQCNDARHVNCSDVLVEEYIHGQEVDIDMVVQDGVVKFLGVSDNKMQEPYFLETGRITPSCLPEPAKKELADLAIKVLKKMGVKNSVVHFEAKYHPVRGAVPIEVNLRMGGDEVYPSISKAWGVDLVVSEALISCGIKINDYGINIEPKTYLASEDLLAEKSGVVARIGIDESITLENGFAGCQFFKEVGDKVLTPPLGSEYLGWVMMSGRNADEAGELLKRAVNSMYCEVKSEKANFLRLNLTRVYHCIPNLVRRIIC